MGQPEGAPASKIIRVRGVVVGTLVQQQAKAGTVELMGGVNSGAPQAKPTLFSLDEGEAKGWVVTSDEASHPGGLTCIILFSAHKTNRVYMMTYTESPPTVV